MILVTPDSERTMCTFLGTAGKINENDVSSNAIRKSEIIFLKVIFGMRGSLKKLLIKQLVMQTSRDVASDQFCVDRHKAHFLELVKTN